MKSAKNKLEEEIDKLIEDITDVYNNSGKRVTGQFEKGLDKKISENRVELYGYTYLAGRPAGKMPPVKAIQKWVRDKGLATLDAEVSSLGWAIAKKIAKEGTNDSSHLPIYEQVLTPQRMDQIIKSVSEFHAKLFVESITVHIMSLSQKYQK